MNNNIGNKAKKLTKIYAKILRAKLTQKNKTKNLNAILVHVEERMAKKRVKYILCCVERMVDENKIGTHKSVHEGLWRAAAVPPSLATKLF